MCDVGMRMAHLCQRPDAIVLDPSDYAGKLDESESRQQAPAVPCRSKDTLISRSPAVDRIDAEES